MASVNRSKRIKMLLENYLSAKQEGLKEGYSITCIDNEEYEHYYILFKPMYGVYCEQYHVLEMKTSYGTNEKRMFPINPPYLKFLTDVYHPNISTQGTICLDILKNDSQWSPSNSFSTIIQNIILLFNTPNPASPLNSDAASVYLNCEKEYNKFQADHKDMKLADLENIKTTMFAQYKQNADNGAKKNHIDKYKEWFPETIEIIHITNILAKMKSDAVIKSKKTDDNNLKSVTTNRWAKYQK